MVRQTDLLSANTKISTAKRELVRRLGGRGQHAYTREGLLALVDKVTEASPIPLLDNAPSVLQIASLNKIVNLLINAVSGAYYRVTLYTEPTGGIGRSWVYLSNVTGTFSIVVENNENGFVLLPNTVYWFTVERIERTLDGMRVISVPSVRLSVKT